MARFALVWIKIPEVLSGVSVRTTHPEVIRELVAVAAQIVPGAKFTNSGDWDSDTSHGGIFWALKDKDRLVAFELVRYLCDQGWEPFQAQLGSGHEGVYLRKAF
jgi:hypothetical protein